MEVEEQGKKEDEKHEEPMLGRLQEGLDGASLVLATRVPSAFTTVI